MCTCAGMCESSVLQSHVYYKRCMLRTCLHTPRTGESVLFCICVCCRETLWSCLSQLITLQEHTIWCDSAQCSSASGTRILIDVKTTKYLKRWSVLWTEDKLILRHVTQTQIFANIKIPCCIMCVKYNRDVGLALDTFIFEFYMW